VQTSLLQTKLSLLQEFGFTLDSNSRILDFGCGNGQSVQEWRNLGYQAFGCDIELQENASILDLRARGIVGLIDTAPYRIPFEDDTFDLVLSDQVFEHVKNYSEAVAEMKRVLKPCGAGLHIFPARWRAVESHTYVPFSSILQSYGWVYLWAKLGIRNEYQKELSARETARRNHEYLANQTNYLSKKEIKNQFQNHFGSVVFCERQLLKHTRSRSRYLYSLSRGVPFLPLLYSTFLSRAVLISHPDKTKDPLPRSVSPRN
jgi:SAM-dependent methyltransferase